MFIAVAQEDIVTFLTQIYTAPFRNIFDQSTEVEHNFGLIYNNFTPKPAYNAYQQIAILCNDWYYYFA